MRALVVAIVFILFTSETFAQSPVTCIGIIRQKSCATVVDFPGPAPNPGDRPCDPVAVSLGCVPEYAYKIGLGGWDTVVNSSGGYVGAGVSPTSPTSNLKNLFSRSSGGQGDIDCI